MEKASKLHPSCQLLDLVIDLDWERVIDHAKNHPEDAAFQDGDGLECPLYLACQYSAPTKVVAALLEACPEATMISSKRREIPLHTACRFGASVEILKVLTADHPHSALAETRSAKTPLMALMEGTIHREQPDDSVMWAKVKVLLEAVARAQNLACRRNGTLLLVHAAISLGSLGCPPKALDMSLQHFADHTRMQDPCGRLPLHVALRQTKWSVQLRRRYKPRENYAIISLLRIHPEAAKVRWRGRYPLQLAVANGHTWENGVQRLFEAFPEAALVVDPKTKLLPFQTAAIPVGQSTASLDTIFRLLLAEPHVLDAYKRPMDDISQPPPRGFHPAAVVALVATFVAMSFVHSEKMARL